MVINVLKIRSYIVVIDAVQRRFPHLEIKEIKRLAGAFLKRVPFSKAGRQEEAEDDS